MNALQIIRSCSIHVLNERNILKFGLDWANSHDNAFLKQTRVRAAALAVRSACR